MTATQTVLSALRLSGIPVEAQAFLASIAEGEGGIDFTILYSGGNLVNPNDPNVVVVNGLREWTGPLTTFPTWAGATTAGGLISTAAGFCQDTGTTWRTYETQFGLTDFTPPSQISFNWQLAQRVFGTRMGANLLQVLQAGETAMIPAYLVGTWPGGANSSFMNRYTANLATLQAPEPAPPPPPPSPPSEVTVDLPATATVSADASGNLVITLAKAAATTAAAAAVALIALSVMPSAGPQSEPTAQISHIPATTVYVPTLGRAVPIRRD